MRGAQSVILLSSPTVKRLCKTEDRMTPNSAYVLVATKYSSNIYERVCRNCPNFTYLPHDLLTAQRIFHGHRTWIRSRVLSVVLSQTYLRVKTLCNTYHVLLVSIRYWKSHRCNSKCLYFFPDYCLWHVCVCVYKRILSFPFKGMSTCILYCLL